MTKRNYAIPLIALTAALSCAALFQAQSAAGAPQDARQNWGNFDSKPVYLYTLRNSSGMEARITNYGGTVTYVSVPDRNKKSGDVVLGFDSLAGYTQKMNSSYFGALIGRYGNRLGAGKFTLDGHSYQIAKNDHGINTLHGGNRGFNSRVWDSKLATGANGESLELHYLSPDGDEGFPGNLNVNVRYTVTARNELRIDYEATTDKDTVLNLTNHSYFNLSGPGSGTILKDKLMIAADRFTPVDKNLIPTGQLEPVAGTPLDFRKSTEIGARINDDNQQLKYAGGYDHNFVLKDPGISNVSVRVEDPASGRVLEVLTTQPGVQFYTGNFLNGSVAGIGGTYNKNGALCLETQRFPDSPNHPNFPTTELKPGETFRSTTVYRFSAE